MYLYVFLRTSMADYRQEDWMVNVPLYAIKSYWEEKGMIGNIVSMVKLYTY